MDATGTIASDGRSMVGTWNGDATWTGTGTEIVAPLMPTNKDQCKKGDWESFGVFKNQGDCVSYVATKGKNPPANLLE